MPYAQTVHDAANSGRRRGGTTLELHFRTQGTVGSGLTTRGGVNSTMMGPNGGVIDLSKQNLEISKHTETETFGDIEVSSPRNVYDDDIESGVYSRESGQTKIPAAY